MPTIYPDIIHLAPHNFLLVTDFAWLIDLLHNENITHLAWTSGFPCTPWSRLSDDPLGFNHPLAQLVVRGTALLTAFRKANLIWTITNETVVPHENLVDDLFSLEKMMDVKYSMRNAVDSGATASRPRLLCLEGAIVLDVPVSTHLQPSLVLKPPWTFAQFPILCPVASGDTSRSPI